MPYANINERRKRQREQYQCKKLEYMKQDNKLNKLNDQNEQNDRRNYTGKGSNLNFLGNYDEPDDDETDDETDSESEIDEEYNDDLLEYLTFLLNYKSKKNIKYKLATGDMFKEMMEQSPIFWNACLKHGFIPPIPMP